MRYWTWLTTAGLLASALAIGCSPAKPAVPAQATPSSFTPTAISAPLLPPPPPARGNGPAARQ